MHRRIAFAARRKFYSVLLDVLGGKSKWREMIWCINVPCILALKASIALGYICGCSIKFVSFLSVKTKAYQRSGRMCNIYIMYAININGKIPILS